MIRFFLELPSRLRYLEGEVEYLRRELTLLRLRSRS